LQKIKDAGYTVVSIGGANLKKLLRNTGLQNELSLQPYVNNAPINIRDALYGVEPRLVKHITG